MNLTTFLQLSSHSTLDRARSCSLEYLKSLFPLSSPWFSPPSMYCIIVLSLYHQDQNCHIKCNEHGLTQSGSLHNPPRQWYHGKAVNIKSQQHIQCLSVKRLEYMENETDSIYETYSLLANNNCYARFIMVIIIRQSRPGHERQVFPNPRVFSC